MTSTLLIVQFALAGLLTVVILLQKSSSIGLGAYSGSNESVFGAKGPAGFLTKMTFTLAAAFIINTLALGYFYNQTKKSSVLDGVDIEKVVPQSSENIPTPTSTAPAAPVSKETK